MTPAPGQRTRNKVLIALAGAVAIGAGALVALRARTVDGANGPPRSLAETVGASASARQGASGLIALSEQALARNPVSFVKAARVRLTGDIQVVGAVSHDEDQFAVVGPLVAGRVARLSVGVGSKVRKGQILGEIESAEVGEARAALLSAIAKLRAAEANLSREKELADKRISSARERELAEAAFATEKAHLRAAEERLRAIGLTAADIQGLDHQHGGRVPMRSPIDGVVIERLVTLGQAVERATDAFKVANLSHVWVMLNLYEKDLARVSVGQQVEVRTEAYPGEVFRARVTYVVPVIDEQTRTANVRVEIENPQGKLRIGQLVTAHVLGDPNKPGPEVLAVPRAAVQRADGKPLVFVKTDAGFQRRYVELGMTGGDLLEIKRGIMQGEEVATDGAFLVKSELLR